MIKPPWTMEQQCRDYLLTLARTYADATGLALTTVGRRFHGTESFFDDFETGERTITLRKMDEMLAEFAEQWPPGTRWPGGRSFRLKKPL